jgi:hypothetical protein
MVEKTVSGAVRPWHIYEGAFQPCGPFGEQSLQNEFSKSTIVMLGALRIALQ